MLSVLCCHFLWAPLQYSTASKYQSVNMYGPWSSESDGSIQCFHNGCYNHLHIPEFSPTTQWAITSAPSNIGNVLYHNLVLQERVYPWPRFYYSLMTDSIILTNPHPFAPNIAVPKATIAPPVPLALGRFGRMGKALKWCGVTNTERHRKNKGLHDTDAHNGEYMSPY